METINTQWLSNYLNHSHGLSHPDWQKIFEYTDTNLQSYDQNLLWQSIAKEWLSNLVTDLDDDYRISESDNFTLLSNAGARHDKVLLKFLERCYNRLLHFLKGIASSEGYGKYVVMVFADNDRYYDYVSYYGPEEGTYGLSSGMYLNYGYGHFVFPHQKTDEAEPIIAHEMTHALVSHLPIPVWLNEGMAVNMEGLVSGISAPSMTREVYAEHREFWTPNTIQEFWSGESFARPDLGQRLSYQLAQILVTNISENYTSFQRFCCRANWQDAGESAMEDIFDLSLGDMIANFIGLDGQWWPTPENWSGHSEAHELLKRCLALD